MSARRSFAAVVGIVLLIAAAQACAHDAFDAVRCDGDIRKALVGSKLGDEHVAQLEKAYAKIGLKNEGGDEISDSLFYSAWTVCSGSYHLLTRDGVIRDVVHADHSAQHPEFVGRCEVKGKATPYSVLAILDAGKEGAAAKKLPASQAWRIDEATAQFASIEARGMMCGREGISTADGGA